MPNALRRNPLLVLLSCAALCAALLAPIGCDSLPRPVAEGLRGAIDAGERDGSYSPDVAAQLRQAVDALEHGSPILDVLGKIGLGLGSTLLAMLGIQIQRGPAKPLDPELASLLRQMAIERKAKGAPPA